jgi:NADPH:quinone reductase-like Zn-dependent oxidoreductase
MDNPAEIIARRVRVRPPRTPTEGEPPMVAVVTSGHGGLDRLQVTHVPRPAPGDGEVLLRVLAAGLNNTDINTRLGWYAASTATGTSERWDQQEHVAEAPAEGGWAGATPFPLIQGVDCCGEVTAVGRGVETSLVGQRVLVRPNMRPAGFASLENRWMGCDFDGAFAQFVVVPASEAFPVASGWSDVELGSIPCAYGTAENMLGRARVRARERVLVTGASGGVGSAAVQLAKRRGATVIAVAGREKAGAVADLGADDVLDRDADLLGALGKASLDVVVDCVGGPGLGSLIELLAPGGRYVACGAIAGPAVSLDLRTVYLRDLQLLGCTAWDEDVFPNLLAAIERNEIRPVVSAVYPLAELAAAQQEFVAKRHVGKIVLVPPAPEA